MLSVAISTLEKSILSLVLTTFSVLILQKDIPLVSNSVKKVLATPEGATAAALVQDFLQCLGLEFSLAVFAPESGHSALWNYPGPETLINSLHLNSDKG